MDVTNGYSTHLEILQDILKNRQIKNVVEFGMGYFSTPVFIENNCNLTSIEMHQEEFYRITQRTHSGKANFILLLGELPAVEWLKKTSEWDMIFVDGHEKSRHIVVNEAFKHTQMIICHDSEAKIYKWNEVVLPLGWRWYDMTKYTPWTSVVTCWDMRDIMNRHPHKKVYKMAEKEFLY